MQRQHKSEPTNRPMPRRPKRSVGELLAGWLLVLLGIAWVGTMFSYVRPWSDNRIFNLILHALYLSPGCLWFLAGMATLLKARKIAQGILMLLTLFLLAWGVLFFFGDIVGNRLVLVVLLPAALFFFLGRWLGTQEDIDSRT